MTVFALSNPVLLRCVWTGNTVRNASALKISMKAMILPSPIGLNSAYFGVKKTLNMILKSVEDSLNIRLVLDEINPVIATVIIDKTRVILKTPRRG
jgi:hypothetical protein